MTDVCNFANNTTFLKCDNLIFLTERSDYDKKLDMDYSGSYYMQLNDDKCHLLRAGHTRYEFLLYAIKKARI